MSPQTAKWACYILGAAGFVLILLVVVDFLFLVLGLLMVIAAIVINLLFYRCPYCGEHLGRNSGSYCPNCGHFVQH